MILAYVSNTNSIVQFLTALLVFVFVIFLTQFSLRWIGKYQKMQSGNRNFEVIETHKVAQNKFLQIIKVGSRFFLIGIGKDEIKYFVELDGEDLDLSTDRNVTQDQFRQFLDKAKDKMHKRSDGHE